MKVAIAGYALEGRVNYKYWLSLGHDVTIVDERVLPAAELPADAKTLMGEGVLENLQDFDLVIRTASLNPTKIKTDGRIWSATNEFFDKCPADIIGVTGTKGKGTTSSLIASILEAAGKTVHLVGNIGTSALDVLPSIKSDDIVVFELSSFQLWDLQKSPQLAVILMIEPDHLNVHRDMNDYVTAKSNIRLHQTIDDLCVYHPSNELSYRAAHVTMQGKLVRYATPNDGGAYERDDYFWQSEQKICPKSALQLLGQHNVENTCAAITATKRYGVSNDVIEKGLGNFRGLPHRLELVREVDGVTYFNDSFSSSPGAAIAAVSSFEQPEVLILGGTDKGADFSALVDELKNRRNIKKILLVGEIRNKLNTLLVNAGVTEVIRVVDVTTMSEIISIAREEADRGDVVLLSPACASFDMFRDFYDRGDQFRSLVQAL